MKPLAPFETLCTLAAALLFALAAPAAFEAVDPLGGAATVSDDPVIALQRPARPRG